MTRRTGGWTALLPGSHPVDAAPPDAAAGRAAVDRRALLDLEANAPLLAAASFDVLAIDDPGEDLARR